MRRRFIVIQQADGWWRVRDMSDPVAKFETFSDERAAQAYARERNHESENAE